jgi:hypothetical protein
MTTANAAPQPAGVVRKNAGKWPRNIARDGADALAPTARHLPGGKHLRVQERSRHYAAQRAIPLRADAPKESFQ